jgi:hypothetical protein
MSPVIVWGYILLSVVSANLPWLSERKFLILSSPKGKSGWIRLLEWLLLYFLIGAIGLGLEFRLDGDIHHQDWEFYAVTLSLFFVFALPGFIWRYDWKRHV